MTEQKKNVLIIGGGNIGLQLAKMLEENFEDVRVKIIEKNKQRVGFLAQDVGDVLEELGFDSNNDMVDIDEVTTQQHVAYSKLVAPMVRAIQELSSKVESQQKEIEELKNK